MTTHRTPAIDQDDLKNALIYGLLALNNATDGMRHAPRYAARRGADWREAEADCKTAAECRFCRDLTAALWLALDAWEAPAGPQGQPLRIKAREAIYRALQAEGLPVNRDAEGHLHFVCFELDPANDDQPREAVQ
jgi:hypothetical protein